MATKPQRAEAAYSDGARIIQGDEAAAFQAVLQSVLLENEYLKGLGLPVNLQATNAELIGVANA